MGTTVTRNDAWSSGNSYESYVGRWSRLVAREFIHWLAAPEQSRWLDVGCGTGALSHSIVELTAPQEVHGIDRSQDYVKIARSNLPHASARFSVGDAQSLPVGSGMYDIAVSGLVLNFVQRPSQMIAEMARAVGAGKTIALYVWDYAGKMQLMRHFWDAVAALDPAASDLDEGRRFPVCNPEPLHDLFQSAVLHQVEVHPIDVATHFKDLDDYWSPFLGGQGPAPGYAMSLSEEQREQLRKRIFSNLPFAADGSIPLVARAWAVKGVK
jgi:trans-aconitate methyltransferase